MMPMRYIYTILIFVLLGCSSAEITNLNYVPRSSAPASRAQRIEMHLSAFGVESDNFPSIDVFIDFSADSSYCKKWYYNPKYKDSVYSLSKAEMLIIASLIEKSDLSKLKKEYRVGETDQPSSKTTIHLSNNTLHFNDYGLKADYPLSELYKIVYKY
jgi:hypothetical protein